MHMLDMNPQVYSSLKIRSPRQFIIQLTDMMRDVPRPGPDKSNQTLTSITISDSESMGPGWITAILNNNWCGHAGWAASRERSYLRACCIHQPAYYLGRYRTNNDNHCLIGDYIGEICARSRYNSLSLPRMSRLMGMLHKRTDFIFVFCRVICTAWEWGKLM